MATPPIDPRLVKRVGRFRQLLVILGSLAFIRAVAWAIAAFTIAKIIVDMQSLQAPSTRLLIIAAIALGIRPVAAWLAEWISRYQAASIKHQLRIQATDAALHTPQEVGVAQGATAAVLTTGTDTLDDWFAQFLPSGLEAAVMPAVMFVVIAVTDWVSLIALIFTVPLLGVFGWLIGVATADQAEKQFDAMTRLSGHFLDLLRGLETLRIFGVANDQENLVRSVADELRTETMKTLKIAFLSALALELIAMVGTALIAVMIGIRLSYGVMELWPGLAVLIMAPEAYLPIRRVGSTYHASTEGAQAGKELLDMIGTTNLDNEVDFSDPKPAPTTIDITSMQLDKVTVIRDGRVGVQDCSITVKQGDFIALVGSSGSGKTTALRCLIGLEQPTSGNAVLHGYDHNIPDQPITATPYPGMPQVAYVPQHPVILAATLGENVALGVALSSDNPVEDPTAILGKQVALPGDPASDNPVEAPTVVTATSLRERIEASLRLAQAHELIEHIDSPVGSGGIRLSGGQVRRLALARAIMTQPRFLLTDEPTSEVDETTAEGIRATLRALQEQGVGIVAATHDPALRALATEVVAFSNQTSTYQSQEDGSDSTTQEATS